MERWHQQQRKRKMRMRLGKEVIMGRAQKHFEISRLFIPTTQGRHRRRFFGFELLFLDSVCLAFRHHLRMNKVVSAAEQYACDGTESKTTFQNVLVRSVSPHKPMRSDRVSAVRRTTRVEESTNAFPVDRDDFLSKRIHRNGKSPTDTLKV